MEVTSLAYTRTRLGLQQVTVSLADLLESSPNIANKPMAVMSPGHRKNKSHLATTCTLPRTGLLGRNRPEETARHSALEAAAKRQEQESPGRVCVEMGLPIQIQQISHELGSKKQPQL